MCVRRHSTLQHKLRIEWIIWNARGKWDSRYGWMYVLYSNDLDRDKRIALLKNKLLVSSYYISFHSPAHEISFFFLSFFCDVRSLAVVWCAVPRRAVPPSNGVRMWNAVVPFGRRASSYPNRSVHSALLLLLIPVYHYRYLSAALDIVIIIRGRNRTISLYFICALAPPLWFHPNRMQEAGANVNMTASTAERSDRKQFDVGSLPLSISCTHMRACIRRVEPHWPKHHLGIAIQVLCQLIHTSRHDSSVVRSTKNA